MTAAQVNAKGSAFEIGAVRPLFEVRPFPVRGYLYDVSGDGQRFLVNTLVQQTTSSPITLVVNWTADLRR